MEKREITTTYPKDFTASESKRKHIILLDGTWNDETGIGADGLVTNIVHLRRIFQNKKGEQIVRYHRGVGNDNDNGWFKSRWDGANGKAIAGIIERAYARFVKDWKSGDRIYIFGFSRGAASARLLASKIANEGVPKSVTIVLEPKANHESKIVEQNIVSVDYDPAPGHKVEVEFVGVWDTVSALGIGNNFARIMGKLDNDLFKDFYVAENVKRAVHLLAIDETRNPFVPSLMNQDGREDVVHEVWFPGVHSDIGGSYLEAEIAKVSLNYMLKKLDEWNKERGLTSCLVDPEMVKKYSAEKVDRANFHFHGLGKGQSLRKIGVQENGKIKDKKPNLHRLYLDITAYGNAWSVFTVKKWFKKDLVRSVNFQYMPFNVKELGRDENKKKKYNIVE